MVRKEVITILVLVMIFGVCPVRADIVELDLFSLGCPTEFDFDSLPWQSDFDLGIEFLEIDSVYINWSGEITAGLAIHYDNPGEPFPLDVGIEAYLGDNPWPRLTNAWGGEETYPQPEIFDCWSEFEIYPPNSWSDLLDGKGTIWIYYTELGFVDRGGEYVEHGYVALNSATLIVNGVIVPEPATFFLVCLGGLFLRKK